MPTIELTKDELETLQSILEDYECLLDPNDTWDEDSTKEALEMLPILLSIKAKVDNA